MTPPRAGFCFSERREALLLRGIHAGHGHMLAFIVYRIWRWLRPRLAPRADPRYSYDRNWFGATPGAGT